MAVKKKPAKRPDEDVIGDGGEIEHPLPYVDGEVAYRRPAGWSAPREPKMVADIRERFRLRPTHDRLLVLEIRQTATEGGILIPDALQDTNKDFRIWVIRVSPGAFAQGFREGQRCRMNQYGGVKLQLKLGQAKGEELHLGHVKTDDIICHDDMED